MASDTDLLDTRGDIQRWNPILGGVLALGAGAAGLFVVPAGWIWLMFVAFLALGAWLVRLGVRAKQSFFRPEGLHRVGWTGAETVPWDRVETIELEAMFGDRDSSGRVRLHCRGRGRITINTTTGSLEGVVARIAEVCTRAVVDDRVVGEVYGPREGGDDPAAVARMDSIRRRASRAFSGTALMWVICGVLLIAFGLVGVGLTVFGGVKNAFLIGLGLVLAGGLCLKLAVNRYRMS